MSMSSIGFTSKSSILKDQAKLANDKGIVSYGVSVVDDLDGKHQPIKSSNAQLHLFMLMKKGRIAAMIFQDEEEAEIFLGNYALYREKKDGLLDGIRVFSVGKNGYLDENGIGYTESESFENALESASNFD